MTEALDADSAADTTVDVTPEAPAEAAPKTSRAGRDLKAAIGVGVGLGALVLGSLLVVKQVFLVILVAAVGLGAWEMRRALASARIQVPLIPVLLGAVSMLLAAYVRGAEALALTFALTCVGIVVWRAAEGTAGALRDSFGGFFVAAYPCLIAGFASLLLAEPDGHLRIIFFILVTVFSDIGGYAVGVLFGKHPMAPSVSPKKSWEGFAGSVAICTGVGVAAMVFMLGGRWWVGGLIGAVSAAVATIGDLIESSLKRDLGIKDMGTLLPGHGGIMDRLDSLVLTLPVVWALLWWLAPAGA
ncbi:MAG: phosphatidate cytidylyltransferase [Actinobacteria bacterium]|jgi:phosphatidate cytidylyltransferase|nr:phosphatidate cytidylyltransferase [Actinomycetota bacterium]